MNLREEMLARAAKLKKHMQREDLDTQKEIEAKIKDSQVVSTNEVWVNRKLLKEMGSVPGYHSGKISYVK